MKKNFVFNLLLTTALSFLFCTGCKKDLISDNSSSKNSLAVKPKSVNSSSNLSGRVVNPALGIIEGTILPPEANVSVYLYGDQDFVLFPDEKGNIYTYIPKGFYTVYISPSNPLYTGYVINDIEVLPGGTTSLGTITLTP